MASDEATLSVQAVVALKAIYQTAEQYFGSKIKSGRKSSMFLKSEFIPPVWAKKYFCRFAHIASSELAARSRPAGLGAVLMILAETRALVLDVYDLKKVDGESSEKILGQISFLTDVIQKLQVLVVGTIEKDHLTHPIYMRRQGEANALQQIVLPLLVLAPITMINQRLFVREGLAGGGNHGELFKMCPEIDSLEREMNSCLQRGNDEFTCLLLATDTIGKVLMRVLENTSLRHRYFTQLVSAHNFCRMFAWAELKKNYGCDLSRSHLWTGVSAFEDSVIHRRRESLSRTPSAASFSSPPPLPAPGHGPPPPSCPPCFRSPSFPSPSFPPRPFPLPSSPSSSPPPSPPHSPPPPIVVHMPPPKTDRSLFFALRSEEDDE